MTDTTVAAKTLQRYQQMADSSASAMKLKQQSATAASEHPAQLQKGIVQRTEEDRTNLWGHIEENNGSYYADDSDGEFVWMDGATSQSLWRSHLHIFPETDEDNLAGQITIRNGLANNGGVNFNAYSVDAVTADVLLKWGHGAAGQQTRIDVVTDLVSLYTDFLSDYRAWQVAQENV